MRPANFVTVAACLFGTALLDPGQMVLAKDLDSASIVDALTPAARSAGPMVPGMRSMRGIEEEEAPAARPSIDLVIEFDSGSAEIGGGSMRTLRRLGAALADPRLAEYRFLVAGHTDAIGDESYNQRLSERRSMAIRDALIVLYDIEASRLDTMGYGETRPADPSNPDAAANRRVQITNIGADERAN